MVGECEGARERGRAARVVGGCEGGEGEGARRQRDQADKLRQREQRLGLGRAMDAHAEPRGGDVVPVPRAPHVCGAA